MSLFIVEFNWTCSQTGRAVQYGHDMKQTKPTAARVRPLNREGLRSQGNAGKAPTILSAESKLIISSYLSGTWTGHTAKVTGNQDVTVSTEGDAKTQWSQTRDNSQHQTFKIRLSCYYFNLRIQLFLLLLFHKPRIRFAPWLLFQLLPTTLLIMRNMHF